MMFRGTIESAGRWDGLLEFGTGWVWSDAPFLRSDRGQMGFRLSKAVRGPEDNKIDGFRRRV